MEHSLNGRLCSVKPIMYRVCLSLCYNLINCSERERGRDGQCEGVEETGTVQKGREGGMV